MQQTYTLPEMQNLVVVAFLKGMDHAADLAKYQKAATRIRRERATLALLNEQRCAPTKTFPRGFEEGVNLNVQHPHRRAFIDWVRIVAEFPGVKATVYSVATALGVISVVGFWVA